MNDKEIKQIIKETVDQTVLKLKMTGLIKDGRKTAFQKTEEVIRNYNAFCKSDQPYAKALVEQIDKALEELNDDPYKDIISLYYIDELTREEIAEQYNTTVSTISRNKTRLINRLKAVLFSDDMIMELFL